MAGKDAAVAPRKTVGGGQFDADGEIALALAEWTALKATAEWNLAKRAPAKLRIGACVVLGLALAFVAANLGFLLFDLNHKSYGDGPILAMTERLRSEPISRAWLREPPYTLSCYGPAFYYVTNALTRLGGWQHSLVPGRIVALASALLAAALAAIAAGRQTKSVELGLLAALIFMVSAPFSEWVPHARVDMLAIAFAAAAYTAVGPRTRSIVISAFCIAAGSLAKPTAALAAVPICAHLLVSRRYRDAGIFCALVSALGAAAWGAVEWASNGFFLTAVLSGNRNPMAVWRGYFFLYQFLCCPFGAVAVLCAGQLLISSPKRFLGSLYSLGFVISLAISVVTICKQGAELNYFLEPALLGSIAIAVDGLPRLCMPGPRRGLAVIAISAAVLGLPYVREVKHQYLSPTKPPKAYAMVQRYLADEPPDVQLLADGRMVDMVLSAGRRPWLNDSYLYMLLVDNGTLDATPLLDRLRDGRIKWLFFRKDLSDHVEASTRQGNCWPLQVIDALPRYYELVEKKNGLWVYRHRSYGVAEAVPATSSSRVMTNPISSIIR